MIEGVEVKELTVHADERGNFAEIIRASDPFFKKEFGQLSFSTVFPGVAKAWHLHKKQTDWMCTLRGDLKLVLYDTRPQAKTYKQLQEIMMGDVNGYKVVKVPPGVAHGYKVLNGPMSIVYVTSREYDPQDELRIPHDDPNIGYDWHAPAEIK